MQTRQDQIVEKLKEYDALLDAIAKTPEKSEWGKKEIRDQLDKVPSDYFKLIALNTGLSVLKRKAKQ